MTRDKTLRTNIKVVLVGFGKASGRRRVGVAALPSRLDGGESVDLVFSQVQGERPVDELQSAERRRLKKNSSNILNLYSQLYLHRRQFLKKWGLVGLEVKLRTPHLELFDGSLREKKKTQVKKIQMKTSTFSFSWRIKSSSELTKDPFSWNVAFWDVTLNAGRGGLMQTEWSWVCRKKNSWVSIHTVFRLDSLIHAFIYKNIQLIWFISATDLAESPWFLWQQWGFLSHRSGRRNFLPDPDDLQSSGTSSRAAQTGCCGLRVIKRSLRPKRRTINQKPSQNKSFSGRDADLWSRWEIPPRSFRSRAPEPSSARLCRTAGPGSSWPPGSRRWFCRTETVWFDRLRREMCFWRNANACDPYEVMFPLT